MGRVLTIDSRFDETGRLSPGLASYAQVAWEQVDARLDEVATGDGVLLLHDAGLLARYADAGGHDLLVGWQNRARNPVAAPRGLWLLCPGESATAAPRLDGMVVEWTDGPERIVLGRDLLDRLHDATSGAA